MIFKLLKSEFHRFGNLKFFIIALFLIPLFNLFIAYMYKKNFNNNLIDSTVKGVYFENYPILFMSEILPFVLDIFVIIFSAKYFYKEQECGYSLFLFLRPISKFKFILTKSIVFYFFLLCIFLLLFLSSYLSGFILLDNNDSIKLFSFGITLSGQEWLVTTVYYYIISFLSLIPIVSISIIVRAFFENSVIANSISIFIWLLNFAYVYIKNTILYFSGHRSASSFEKYDYFSVVQFQGNGILKVLKLDDKVFIFDYLAVFFVLLVFSIFIYQKRGLIKQ